MHYREALAIEPSNTKLQRKVEKLCGASSALKEEGPASPAAAAAAVATCATPTPARPPVPHRAAISGTPLPGMCTVPKPPSSPLPTYTMEEKLSAAAAAGYTFNAEKEAFEVCVSRWAAAALLCCCCCCCCC